MSDIRRYWAKVSVGGPDECWPWTGATSNGYGYWDFEGQNRLAHRVAYQLQVGPIPDGLHIDHLCRNRGCQNAAHMEPVTLVENVLRGQSKPALNAKATHCDRGHEFTPANTYTYPPGRRARKRLCRTCHIDSQRRRRAARRVRA